MVTDAGSHPGAGEAGRARWLNLLISGGTVLGFGLASGVALDRLFLA